MSYKTDIEIAQECQMKIAEMMGFYYLHKSKLHILCKIPSCKLQKCALLYRHKEVIPMI